MGSSRNSLRCNREEKNRISKERTTEGRRSECPESSVVAMSTTSGAGSIPEKRVRGLQPVVPA